MSAEEFNALRAKEKRQPKYHNRRVTVGDQHYDSVAEQKRHEELKLMEQQGVIANLRRQVPHHIVINGVLVCTYRSDFEYDDLERGMHVVEDIKSPATITPTYRLKKKLLSAAQGVEITEVDA